MDDIPKLRSLKKIVPDGNNGWEERIFYRVSNEKDKSVKWLIEKYGNSNYATTWWSNGKDVIMSEKIYTHYALSV